MSKTGIAVVIIIIAIGAGYAYTFSQVTNALEIIEIDFYDMQIIDFSLIPPSADFNVILLCNNPTQYEIELRGNIDMYYGDSYITTLEIDDIINPNGHSTVDCPFHLSSSTVLDAVWEGFADWRYSGSITATHRIFGLIPVVINRSL